MPSHRRARPRLYLLLLTFCLLPGVLVLTNLPWLKHQSNDTVFLITGIAGTMAILAGLALSIVHDRGLGEWERSNLRFATFWGDATAMSLVGLLLCLPFGREWIIAVVTHWADPSRIDQLVVLGFAFGFMVVALARVACLAVLSITWSLWKSRAAREPS